MQPSPDLSALDSEYQVLTELHRSDDTHTFLARHLGLNRDVTITIVRAASADALKSYDADVKRLVTLRHPNVVPTIEGRFLDDLRYAVVHAHSRGPTLDQSANSGNGMPLPEAASALQQTHAALTWAREHGIENRHITPDELVFQQGSERVLVALTPTLSTLSGASNGTARHVPDACADARTIGELAFTMLSGRRVEDAGTYSLAAMRSDLPTALVVQTETLLRCDVYGVVPNVNAYIEQFTPIAAPAPRGGIIADAEVPVPVASRADTVIVTQNRDRGMSFGARFATTVVVLAVIGIGAMFVLKQRQGTSTETARIGPDTAANMAAGDIALRARQSDSLLAAQGSQPVIVAPPADAQPMPQPQMQPPMSSAMPATVAPMSTAPMSTAPTSLPPDMQTPPTSDVHRRDPVRPTTPVTDTAPPSTSPTPVTTPVPTPPVTNSTPVTTPAITPVAPIPPVSTTSPDSARPSNICDSPAPDDQRRCLSNAVDRKDAAVNEIYQRVVRALRRQANAQPEDEDPPTVDELRVDQHAWQESRDAACRDVGSGSLFARERASCINDQSDRRIHALQAKLESIISG